jgi:glycerol-3-phosphate acyltransferase PlsY
MQMSFPAWLLFSYLFGAVPCSVWLGRLLYRVDPRDYGDGNPGAANAFRAGGRALGAAVLVLDFLKAFVPVAIVARGINFAPEQLFCIALAPTVGHAFSVFLRFHGGRALVTLFGVWCALTLYEVPLIMGTAAVLLTLFLKKDDLTSVMILLVVIGYLLVRNADNWVVILAAAQLLIVTAKIGPFRLISSVISGPVRGSIV